MDNLSRYQALCLIQTIIDLMTPDPFAAFVLVVEAPEGAPPRILHNTNPKDSKALLREAIKANDF